VSTKIPKALTIAGSDSGGGAGIQADLKTFAAFGVYGSSVITAVTAQNTRHVTGVHVIPSDVVVKQIEAVLSDIGCDAIKIGMLANAGIIQGVTACLSRYPKIPVVVDPVMVAKSGDVLLERDAIRTMREQLLPLAEVVTPNIPEAEVLLGRNLQSEEDYTQAARDIFAMGARSVLLKGGHRPRHEKIELGRNVDSPVVDFFYDGKEIRQIEGPFIDTPHTHGTGCTLSAALAAGLANGLKPYPAALQAREFLTGALRNAFPVGHGKGPVHHFHSWWSRDLPKES
jgi:hydroxymethylpyrimidine/phosphomethylpyrimidine kinase